jgi:putative component of membrane protein insertase Oxa1/YidC/SpoIIIJ protein YidD
MRYLARALAAVLIFGVRLYQWGLRPLLPPMCKFTPGCSEYFILSVKKYGPIRRVSGESAAVALGPWVATIHHDDFP